MNAILDFIGIHDTDAQELIKASVREQNIDMMREKHKDDWCAVSGEIEAIGDLTTENEGDEERTVIDLLTDLDYYTSGKGTFFGGEDWSDWGEKLFVKRKGGFLGLLNGGLLEFGSFVRHEGDQKQRDTYLKCCSEMIH